MIAILILLVLYRKTVHQDKFSHFTKLFIGLGIVFIFFSTGPCTLPFYHNFINIHILSTTEHAATKLVDSLTPKDDLPDKRIRKKPKQY